MWVARLDIDEHLAEMDRHAYLWAGLPAVQSPVLGQLVPNGQSRLHGALRHLLQCLWQAKDGREQRGRGLDEEASKPLDFFRDGLVPVRRSRPWFHTRGVLLQGLWPRHIDCQHHDRLLLPGRFQRWASRPGGAATTHLRWPEGGL